MADEDIHDGLQDEPWEERTLHLLYNSKIDQDFSIAKVQKSGRKKHKVRWMSKRAMAIPQVIIELQDQALRESTLRCLSTFLLEEVLTFSQLMVDGSLTVRATKRLVNVLTLFQCIAANKETRYKFVKSHQRFMKMFEQLPSLCLALCQTREPEIIQWALESNMVEVCKINIEIGSELSKVFVTLNSQAVTPYVGTWTTPDTWRALRVPRHHHYILMWQTFEAPQPQLG
ncbi:hypothetical protein ACSBR1_034520 [Camellia fascicularis]